VIMRSVDGKCVVFTRSLWGGLCVCISAYHSSGLHLTRSTRVLEYVPKEAVFSTVVLCEDVVLDLSE
jgi:hypothetical protein